MADPVYAAEVWLKIPNFDCYEASSEGRIRRVVSSTNSKAGTIINGHVSRTGYLYFNATVGFKRRKTVKIHRLVCEAFHGPQPSPGHVVAHADGNPANNAAINLRWATPKENHSDRYVHGTDPTGSRNPRSKLNERTVSEIRASYANSEANSYQLAERYGVYPTTIQKLLRRETWRKTA